MIRVSDLKKSYGDTPALTGINFEVHPGEIFGLLGPNGAGKTTTLKILTGRLLPTYGEAWIDGKNVITEIRTLQKELGIVPEGTNLYERLSIQKNLEFFCRLYDVDTGCVEPLLNQVNLLKEKNIAVKKLSKGMKQRVLLARALLHKPRVLFLDEPTSGLDPASAGDIHQMLQQLNSEGVTILLTSHNMEEVDRLCHRVAFLHGGSIAALGSPEELKLKYTKRQVRVVLDEHGHLSEKYLSLSGDESGQQIHQWMREGKIRAIHSCEATLADIFMHITGRELA